MTLLLDTCDFLWFVSGSPNLSAKLKSEIEDTKNTVFLSVVSLWEIIVKQNLGKLHLPRPAAHYVPEQRDRHRMLSLDLHEPAVKLLSDLPFIHRDPFDRMLICQARHHEMRIASSDPIMTRYPVALL